MSNSDRLVSVIVPVYNVEKYLDECVSSIVNQSYSNLEIILVDDGSTDSSSRICDKWAEKDKRVKVIHKLNGGLSDARNVGVEQSCGEYIVFVDSDDIVASFYVQKLYDMCVRNNVPLSICRHVRFNDGEFPVFCEKDGNVQVLNSKETILLFFGKYQTEIVAAWTKMYRRDLVCKVKFPVGMINEDAETFWKYIELAEKTAFGEDAAYGYRMRVGSITKQKYSLKCLDILEIDRRNLQYYRSKDEDIYKHFLVLHIFELFASLMKIRCCLDSVETKSIYQSLRKELYSCLTLIEEKDKKMIPRKYRIGFRVFTYCPFLYRLYFVLHNGKRFG